MRHVHHLQEEVFKRREEGLKKKDLELQESLIRFSKFLQENDAKRMHALKKAQDERKTREEKEKEIEQLVRSRLELAAPGSTATWRLHWSSCKGRPEKMNHRH